MAVLSVVLLVLFIIVVVLLILLVLVQNEEGDSLGGVFAGGSSSVFGSRSGNILTRATSVLGVLFLALSFGMALLNRTPGDKGVEAAGRRIGAEQNADWWQLQDEAVMDDTPPALESSPSAENPPLPDVEQ
ncbi:MAG: preprotein translocase subunit SecG [Spirochaetaceae bacterium]|jgi:preprotein translocase subunit SecG|nr:preprotein translocase subunit SecG [Spirochaetaceae bacterium]